MKVLAVLSFAAVTCQTAFGEERRYFPEDFVFGCASSAYQVENAWNEDGKGENIWHYMTHNTPDVIKDKSNGDITGDSYKCHVELMRELGLDAYRFTLSWSRILPNGFAWNVNPAGIMYYNNLIDELLKYNIMPMVTLFQWDLPQDLEELGGFINPLIAVWFADYARVVFKYFGDRVKHWITFNEPREICYEGYSSTTKAITLNDSAVGTYICAKNLLLAHANAYHLYNNDFKRKQGGQCGIAISVNWFKPATNCADDKFAAKIKKQDEWGIYAEPIFSAKGGFPKELSERIAKKSAEQGYRRSRLPALSVKERSWVRGSADFFGVNHYTAFLISATKEKSPVHVPSLLDDLDCGPLKDGNRPVSASPWLTLVPDSIYQTLTDLQKIYNNPVFYITENGWSTAPNRGLNDDDRITYYRAMLESVLDALDAGVNLKGYMAWSLLDNFEWMDGYTQRFGLYQVNFEIPTRTCTPRKSAFVYKHILKHRYIDHDYEPDSMTMTIDEGH